MYSYMKKIPNYAYKIKKDMIMSYDLNIRVFLSKYLKLI